MEKAVNLPNCDEWLRYHKNKKRIIDLQIEREGHARAVATMLETVAYCRQRIDEINQELKRLADDD